MRILSINFQVYSWSLLVFYGRPGRVQLESFRSHGCTSHDLHLHMSTGCEMYHLQVGSSEKWHRQRTCSVFYAISACTQRWPFKGLLLKLLNNTTLNDERFPTASGPPTSSSLFSPETLTSLSCCENYPEIKNMPGFIRQSIYHIILLSKLKPISWTSYTRIPL